MRVLGLLLVTAGLAGCGALPEQSPVPRQSGRYAGIGLYAAGEMWQRMVAAERPREAATATLRDDETVIVVVDSHTGEVRQCGNHTGYCIAMQPWAGALGREQRLPVSLTEHLAEVEAARDRERAAATAEIDAAVNAAQPAGR